MKSNKDYWLRLAIYAFVVAALSFPLVKGYSVKPARMDSAEQLFGLIEGLDPQPGQIAFVALDFGPNTKAENEAQARVVIEHLMRKRVPIALFSLYVLAEPFLKELPAQIARELEAEFPGQEWKYGKDWVNLGYRPGGYLIIQSIPKASNIVELFEKDARGNSLEELPAFKRVKTVEDIIFLGEFTGLVGMFNVYVQFFKKGDYRPKFGHGCTSITIPEAYIFLDSQQLDGLLEGIAGAAWYSELLYQKYTGRKEHAKDNSILINTGLGVAHLVVIFFVVIGNILHLWSFSRRRAA